MGYDVFFMDHSRVFLWSRKIVIGLMVPFYGYNNQFYFVSSIPLIPKACKAISFFCRRLHNESSCSTLSSTLGLANDHTIPLIVVVREAV